MKKIAILLVLCLFASGKSFAFDPELRQQKMKEFKNMTPEQREAKKAEMKAKWQAKYDQADPETKKKMDERKAKRQARREKWKSMSPEERQAAKAEFRAKREQRHKQKGKSDS